MKLAILGTRGIPNNHGGFEQFAEYLSKHLVDVGHQVSVYCSASHPYVSSDWNGVHLIHAWDPEDKIGTIGQFIYDFNCIIDSRKRNFDAILQLGYTSSSVWGWLLPKKALIITNMDGLEWKRSKYSPKTQKFLKYAEKWAVGTSDHLVSDSKGIQTYLKEKYGEDSKYIAYGAELFSNPDITVLDSYRVRAHAYDLLIARLEPENNVEVILEGVVQSGLKRPFLVIGKHETDFGNYLKDKFRQQVHIHFLGGIYNLDHLNNLRHFSNLYFHGHSVGGTNPSLLEAMASNALIIAHNNVFNKGILETSALYFDSAADIAGYLNVDRTIYMNFIEENKTRIREKYLWPIINRQYAQYILECLDKHAG